MNLELQKRIITSVILLSLLTFMFFYTFILIISLMVMAVIVWIEFYNLISKIISNNNYIDRFLRLFYKALSLLYLSMLVYLVIAVRTNNTEFERVVIFSILISIMTDVGGLIVGKIFKGKKLTKISPKKTISGSLGSFVFSLLLIPFFIKYFPEYYPLKLFLLTMAISLISQVGDLFISLLKRKANVKNTSDLLPGHGGVLDRVDGLIFSIPFGILIFYNF